MRKIEHYFSSVKKVSDYWQIKKWKYEYVNREKISALNMTVLCYESEEIRYISAERIIFWSAIKTKLNLYSKKKRRNEKAEYK